MTAFLVFVSVSVILGYISRRSLTDLRAHGFYRFLAWECIAALVCLNFVSLQHWFHDPGSPRQIVSWTLLLCSLVPGVFGTHELRVRGMPDVPTRHDAPTLLPFEATTALVTSGVFRYIRHPMYSSLLLLNWGVFFKRPTAISAVLALGATAFLAATARAEEAEDIRFFGEQYAVYSRSTKRFVPWIW